MRIAPTSLSTSQLFSSNNEQFVIPAYQRRYSWQFKQLAELYKDIELLKENENHLLGNIVCLTSSHQAGINPLEVVDGQQRVTTISLFLHTIRNRFIELKKTEFADEIKSYLFCKGIDRVPKNKVLLGDLDNPDYEKVISQIDLKLVKNPNLLVAYNFYKDRVDKLKPEKLYMLYFKLINNVLIIRLDVAEAKDAYKLFETINNRGLNLNPTDIIKNFLLGHASSIDDQTLIRIRENWKNLIINLDGIETDDFFRQFTSGILTKKITFTYLVDEFKSYYLKTVIEARNLPEYQIYNKIKIQSEEEIKTEVKGEDYSESEKGEESEKTDDNSKISIVECSRRLRDASEIYRKLLNRKFDNSAINRHLYNLQRIKSFPTYTFLLNIFQRDALEDKIKVEILKILEVFMLRRHICEYRTGELDDIFSKLVKLDSEDILIRLKLELLKDLPSDEEFTNKFATADFRGNEDRAKYVLENFEYDLIGDTGELLIKSGREVHLEHIIPKTIDTIKAKKEFGDWKTYLGDNALKNHKDYVNKIGNLTILGQKLNIVASNNPFEAKKKEYQKSNITMTKEIAKKYNDFRFTEVDSRGKVLAQKAPTLWNLTRNL